MNEHRLLIWLAGCLFLFVCGFLGALLGGFLGRRP